MFLARARMLEDNPKGVAEYNANNYVCKYGEHEDDPDRVPTFRLYEHHRVGLDLTKDSTLERYFQLIIHEREMKQK